MNSQEVRLIEKKLAMARKYADEYGMDMRIAIEKYKRQLAESLNPNSAPKGWVDVGRR